MKFKKIGLLILSLAVVGGFSSAAVMSLKDGSSFAVKAIEEENVTFSYTVKDYISETSLVENAKKVLVLYDGESPKHPIKIEAVGGTHTGKIYGYDGTTGWDDNPTWRIYATGTGHVKISSLDAAKDIKAITVTFSNSTLSYNSSNLTSGTEVNIGGKSEINLYAGGKTYVTGFSVTYGPKNTEPNIMLGSDELTLGAKTTESMNVSFGNLTNDISVVSEDTSVATVNVDTIEIADKSEFNLEVTGVAAGSTKITLTSGTLVKSFDVNVVTLPEYKLVTSSDTIESGTKFVLGVTTEEGLFLNGGLNTTYFDAVKGYSEDNFAFSNYCVPFEVESTDGGYYLKQGGKYLHVAKAESNNLDLVDEATGTSIWNISVAANSEVTISNAAGSNYGTIKYNSTSPRFTNYTSNQTAIKMYAILAPSFSLPSSIDVIKGEDGIFNISLLNTESYVSINVESKDEGIALASNDGLGITVHGVGPGSTTIDVTITFPDESQVTKSISVNVSSADKTLTSIELSGYSTSIRKDELYSFDGIVTAHYSDTSSTEVEPTSISPVETSTTGIQEVTVSYQEGEVLVSKSFNLRVLDKLAYELSFSNSTRFSEIKATDSIFSVSESIMFSDHYWTLEGASTDSERSIRISPNIDSNKGQQFGTNNNYLDSLSLASNNFGNIKFSEVEVNLLGGTAASTYAFDTYVNETKVGSFEGSGNSANKATFMLDEATFGNVKINFTNAFKGVWITSIKVYGEVDETSNEGKARAFAHKVENFETCSGDPTELLSEYGSLDGAVKEIADSLIIKDWNGVASAKGTKTAELTVHEKIEQLNLSGLNNVITNKENNVLPIVLIAVLSASIIGIGFAFILKKRKHR